MLRLHRTEDENVANVPLDDVAQHGTANPVRAWPAKARLVKGHHRATENGMHAILAHEEKQHAVKECHLQTMVSGLLSAGKQHVR